MAIGWADFVSAPLVCDFLWAKFTAGMELDGLLTAKTPGQVRQRKRSSSREVWWTTAIPRGVSAARETVLRVSSISICRFDKRGRERTSLRVWAGAQ